MEKFRYRHLIRKPRSKATGGYKQRNDWLKELGYSSYQEYLQSEDWRAIRERILHRDPECVLCRCPSTQVHHFSYHYKVLLGLQPRLLFGICEQCHHEVEFNGKEKRTLEESQEYLLLMLKNRKLAGTIRIVYAHEEKVNQKQVRKDKRREDNIEWEKRYDRKVAEEKKRLAQEKQLAKQAAKAKARRNQRADEAAAKALPDRLK